MRILKTVLIVTLAAIATGVSRMDLKAAPEVTCGWCGSSQFLDGPRHMFGNGGDQCLWPAPGWENVQCSRCGGTSSCHTDTQPGNCHIACGGTEVTMVEAAVERAIATGSERSLREALALARRNAVVVEYNSEGGRVEIIANCNINEPSATFAVLPTRRAVVGRVMSAVL
jgi:hypothetical protein